MNKFLLLALMLLLGVLAFALGLFSKESSTALSQYVPDSVGEMFSTTTRHQSTDLNTQQEKKRHAAIAALVMPDSVNVNLEQTALINNVEKKSPNTLKSSENAKDAVIEISDALMAEMQQELSSKPSLEALANIKQTVNEVETENQVLKEKLISLNEQSKESIKVLEKLEKQLRNELNAQKALPNGRDDLIKELEKKIQSLNH